MGASFRAAPAHWRRALEQAGWGRPAGEGPIRNCGGPSPWGPLALQQQLGARRPVGVGHPAAHRATGASRLRLCCARSSSGSLERLLLALGRTTQARRRHECRLLPRTWSRSMARNLRHGS